MERCKGGTKCTVRRCKPADTWAESNDGEEFDFDGVDNISSSDS
jgi:hypothetical protein